MHRANQIIYHLARLVDWRAALQQGAYRGSEEDRDDGFLHFSTGDQIADSAARHRSGEAGLLLLHVPVAALGDALRWEASGNGQFFPHLYGELPVEAVLRVDPLRRHGFVPAVPRAVFPVRGAVVVASPLHRTDLRSTQSRSRARVRTRIDFTPPSESPSRARMASRRRPSW